MSGEKWIGLRYVLCVWSGYQVVFLFANSTRWRFFLLVLSSRKNSSTDAGSVATSRQRTFLSVYLSFLAHMDSSASFIILRTQDNELEKYCLQHHDAFYVPNQLWPSKSLSDTKNKTDDRDIHIMRKRVNGSSTGDREGRGAYVFLTSGSNGHMAEFDI